MENKGFTGSYYDRARGYFRSLSNLSSGTLVDDLLDVLGQNGYIGTVQQRLDGFFEAKTGVIGDRHKAEWEFWRNNSLSFSPGPVVEEYLLAEDGGFILTEDGGKVVLE